MNTAGAGKKGFTLLELLIVIAIIAVLSTLLIVVLDPSETLKRTRDSQRVADLNTMKTAIGIYLAESPNPSLDSGQGDCLNGSAGVGRITYSYNGSPPLTTCYTSAPPLGSDAAGSLSANILNTVPTNPTFGWIFARALNPISTALAFGPPNPFCTSVSSTAYTAVNGTGWIPISFTSLIGGSPIEPCQSIQ